MTKFTLIDLLFVVGVLGVLATLAIPGLMRARGAAQSSSAVGTMRVINSAQLSYAITCGFGFYSPDFQTLAKLPPGAVEGFLPPELGTDVRQVRLHLQHGRNGGRGRAGDVQRPGGWNRHAGYAAVADQMDIAAPQGRFFGTNADGVIYEHNDSLAAIANPAHLHRAHLHR